MRTGKRGLGAFWQDRRGVSFVEFAIIAPPLLLLFFGLIDLGLIFWASYELENATLDASRLIRTGQARSMDAAGIKAAICSEVVILSNCANKVQISIQTASSFGALTPPDPIGPNGNLVTTLDGDPTQVGPVQPVLMNSYYEWPLINPLTGAFLRNLKDGNLLLQSAAVFRSEPF